MSIWGGPVESGERDCAGACGQRDPRRGSRPQVTAPPQLMLSTLAPAKINLHLHVTGRRDDGYHLLDSLVVFAGAGDRVAVFI